LIKNESCLPKYSLVWHSENGKYIHYLFLRIHLAYLKSSLWKFYGRHHDMVDLSHKWPRICSTCPKHFPVLSLWLIIGFVTGLTHRVPLMQQKLLPLPEQLSSLSVFRWDSCYSISRFMCMLWINIGCNKMIEMELMYMNYNTKSIHGENTHTANN
jgi:hypothetical protein